MFLHLIVVNGINPGQIASALPEAAWVLLFLVPVYVAAAVVGSLRDRVTALLLFVLPLPWIASPLESGLDRHRTEYYDTFAVMAVASFVALLFCLGDEPAGKPYQYGLV